ncbi:MAG: hypothetical protein ACYSWZ_00895 [Planctomycetota bacterium]|jgi:hypothetical protein
MVKGIRERKQKGSNLAQNLNLSNLLYYSVYFAQVKSRLIAQNPQVFFLSFTKNEEKQSTFSNSETAYIMK